MKVVTIKEPGKLKIIEARKPTISPYQALVKTEKVAICNATDGKLLSGHFPGVNKYPLVLGHEGCGIVEAVGEKVLNFNIGDRVIGGLKFDFSDINHESAWGGFSEYTLANDHDAMVADGCANEENGWFEVYEIQRAVDKAIPVNEAVMLCTWREVLGAFGDFNLIKGDKILIYGAGPVGLSFLKFGKLLGMEWIGVVDPLQGKRNKALEMGAIKVFDPTTDELASYISHNKLKLDKIIDAVGRPSIINAALPMIKMGGSVCVYGVISEEEILLKKANGPYNFNLYIHQWPTRWREKEAQVLLTQWIKDAKLSAGEFVTHEFPIVQISEAFSLVKSGAVIKCLLHF
jgi:2-desacetyl-2-hydroxyethyl bacteriochlorophyllide A dehydrogenase